MLTGPAGMLTGPGSEFDVMLLPRARTSVIQVGNAEPNPGVRTIAMACLGAGDIRTADDCKIHDLLAEDLLPAMFAG